jgi:hypothetical protein
MHRRRGSCAEENGRFVSSRGNAQATFVMVSKVANGGFQLCDDATRKAVRVRGVGEIAVLTSRGYSMYQGTQQ